MTPSFPGTRTCAVCSMQAVSSWPLIRNILAIPSASCAKDEGPWVRKRSVAIIQWSGIAHEISADPVFSRRRRSPFSAAAVASASCQADKVSSGLGWLTRIVFCAGLKGAIALQRVQWLEFWFLVRRALCCRKVWFRPNALWRGGTEHWTSSTNTCPGH